MMTAKTLTGLALCGLLMAGCGNTDSTTTTAATTTTSSTTVTTYEYMVYPNEGANNVEVASVYIGPGSLTLITAAGAPTGNDPIFVKTHPNNSWIYEANAGSDNIFGFSVNSSTAVLAALPAGPYATVTGVTSLAINSTGAFLFAAGSSQVATLAISSDGALTPITGSAVSQALPSSPSAMAFTTVNGSTYLNVAAGDGVGTAAIYTYLVDPNYGILTPESNQTFPGLKISGLSASPSGTIVYAALQQTASTGEVLSFTVGASGTLSSPVNTISLDEAPGELVSTTSGYVYVGGNADELFAYTTDANGNLTPVAGAPYAVGAPIDFLSLDPSQTLLYGSSVSDDAIYGFQIQSGGGLTAAANNPYSALTSAPGHVDFVQFSY